MNTITFTNKNSYYDFGLVLAKRRIGEATARTNYVDVPARDGLLDYTEAFGEVKYKNRTHSFVLQYIGADAEWLQNLSAFTNYVNGQRHKIFIEENYYWLGRCYVKDAESNNGIREIEVEADCEPYKYRLEETAVETKRKNLFNHASSALEYPKTVIDGVITNNGDGSFSISMEAAQQTARINIYDLPLEVGKVYTFSQYVDELQVESGVDVVFEVGVDYVEGGSAGRSIPCEAGKRVYTQIEITGEVEFVTIYMFLKHNNTLPLSGVVSRIQIEEGAHVTPYLEFGTAQKTIVNDRMTVTPRVTAIAGEPLLKWTDKRTGAQFAVAIAGFENQKILDFKLYEGTNDIMVTGGDIRLTYQEGSL